LIVVSILMLSAALRIAPEHQRLVVFRLGRFLGVYGPGLSFLIPFLDRAVAVDLRERVRRIEGEVMLTQDRKRITADLVWSYQIVDPARSVLEVEDLEAAAQEMAIVTLRSVIGSMERYDLFENREQASARLQDRLGQIVEPWGAEVRHVEVREIKS